MYGAERNRLAGSETTAAALRGAILFIYTNARVLAKLRAEIADAKIPSPPPDAVAKKLTYLQAIIKESMRMVPPITGALYKDVPAEGDTYQGKFIPSGTRIGVSIMGVCRDRAIWGEDVDVFRPERFLEGTPDELKEREAAADLQFSSGRWACLGRQVAAIELNKAIIEVCFCFWNEFPSRARVLTKCSWFAPLISRLQM